MTQVRALKSFAVDRGLILIFLSQIDRSYDATAQDCPGLEHVRLPNPLDLALFDKSCFLNNGEVQFAAVKCLVRGIKLQPDTEGTIQFGLAPLTVKRYS